MTPLRMLLPFLRAQLNLSCKPGQDFGAKISDLFGSPFFDQIHSRSPAAKLLFFVHRVKFTVDPPLVAMMLYFCSSGRPDCISISRLLVTAFELFSSTPTVARLVASCSQKNFPAYRLGSRSTLKRGADLN